MAKGIFMHKPGTGYDDRPEEFYHFPKLYKSRVDAVVGDWVIYYEPGKGKDARKYKAVAEISGIRSDPNLDGHFYADVVPNSFQTFINPVPLHDKGIYYNSQIQKRVGLPNGLAQAAVHPVSEEDFWTILKLGTGQLTSELPRYDIELENSFNENQADFIPEVTRDRVDVYLNRPFRDKAFRECIITAYDKRCAFTGLRFINGGGRAEVQAAHIKPVVKNGPDSVNNGLALSGTVHWMFDRGLLSVSDNFDILVSRKVNNIDEVNRLISPNRKVNLPKNEKDWPNPYYLQWHRKEFEFEG